MLIHGSCHCGNLRFRLDWRPEPSAIPARACSCSFCVKHGGVWTSCPDGALVVEVRDPMHHSRYRFGTRTADFHVCTTCGAVPVVTSEIDGHLHAVVNVNAMEGVAPELLQRATVSFDDEETSSRLERRKKRWIADVRFEPAAVQGAAA